MPSLPASEVQQAIAGAGYRWEARDTRISELARSAQPGSLFGLSIGEPERIALMQEGLLESRKFSVAAVPPPFVDWRDNNGNWVTSVKDQRACGACVAFSTCAVLESRTMIEQGMAELDIDLSEAHLFACGGGQCATGWNFEPALQQARSAGVGLEKAFEYEPKDVPCKNIPASVRVSQWSRVTAMNARKHAIASNGPVIAGMRVFSDFYSYGAGVYKHAIGGFEGLHAVAVVGYNDPDGYWIIKNSWDTDWGEDGYVRMAYGECGVDSEFPFFDPEVSVVQALVA